MRTFAQQYFDRTSMAAMLSSLSREEQQWTLDYLWQLIYMPISDSEPDAALNTCDVTPFVKSLCANVELPHNLDVKEEYHKHLMEKYG